MIVNLDSQFYEICYCHGNILLDTALRDFFFFFKIRLTETGRPSLTLGITIPQAGVLNWTKHRKEEKPQQVMSLCFLTIATKWPAAWRFATTPCIPGHDGWRYQKLWTKVNPSFLKLLSLGNLSRKSNSYTMYKIFLSLAENKPLQPLTCYCFTSEQQRWTFFFKAFHISCFTLNKQALN